MTSEKMTLIEAIEDARGRSTYYHGAQKPLGDYYKQISEWLIELKELKEFKTLEVNEDHEIEKFASYLIEWIVTKNDIELDKSTEFNIIRIIVDCVEMYRNEV